MRISKYLLSILLFSGTLFYSPYLLGILQNQDPAQPRTFTLAQAISKVRHSSVLSAKEDIPTVKKWKVPFKTVNRNDFKTIGIVSLFGAPRKSYIKGHIHTATDMVPKKSKSKDPLSVYPIAEGKVISIHLSDPHRTIVIAHKLPSGRLIYSSYKHLFNSLVSEGDLVTTETLLGRMYTKAEAKKLGGNYNHLHLEIRKDFKDEGSASWSTMTKKSLNSRFYNPQIFLRDRLANKPLNDS